MALYHRGVKIKYIKQEHAPHCLGFCMPLGHVAAL
jgi:hypothetical protein